MKYSYKNFPPFLKFKQINFIIKDISTQFKYSFTNEECTCDIFDFGFYL